MYRLLLIPLVLALSNTAHSRPYYAPQATANLVTDMVRIPAGSFNMGSSEDGGSAAPVHRVNIDYDFEIGRTEVTQGLWKAVMGNNPSTFHNCGDDCPVDSVSWQDIQTFLNKLNARTGEHYRLPSESEWEYACHAGRTETYCGNNNLHRVGWYNRSSANTTHPVGLKQPNAFGLYDMSGNVSEWVQDNVHKNYNGAPSDGRAWENGGRLRLLRGGSWADEEQDMRATARLSSTASERHEVGGFRLVKTMP